jgi:hypothetical protein
LLLCCLGNTGQPVRISLQALKVSFQVGDNNYYAEVWDAAFNHMANVLQHAYANLYAANSMYVYVETSNTCIGC